jgi:hypothetical protein
MNVGIGTLAAQFLFWEYLLKIIGIVSLQLPWEIGCKIRVISNPTSPFPLLHPILTHLTQMKVKRRWNRVIIFWGLNPRTRN